MSHTYQVSPTAQGDMLKIFRFIGQARQNPSAAFRLLDEFERSFVDLARIPSLGHRRPDLVEDAQVFFYTVRKSYMVAFIREVGSIYILRVFHGAQNIRAELHPE